MNVGDVFAVQGGMVTPKRAVTIVGAGGGTATLSPGVSFNFQSSMGGVSGAWIAANLHQPVPSNWIVG